jgi:hypothetical protein
LYSDSFLRALALFWYSIIVPLYWLGCTQMQFIDKIIFALLQVQWH